MALIRFKKEVKERTSIYMNKMIEAYGEPVKVCENEEEEIYFFAIPGTEINLFYDQFFVREAGKGVNEISLSDVRPEKDHEKTSVEEIQDKINESLSWGHSIGSISDGYHTFDELYAHRIVLFRALCKHLYEFELSDATFVWKSTLHSDGSEYDEWFIAGLFTDKGKQITYHVPMSEFDEWPGIVLHKAPEFDGHTSDDVLKRLREL